MLVPRTLVCGLLVAVLRVCVAAKYSVGVLMVNSSATNRFDIQRIGPAIDIAVGKCYSEFGIDLELIPGYYQRGCSQEKAIGKATDLTTHCNGSTITAFIGPACSDDLQIVGRYASYKGIPILTGLGDVLAKRDQFTTLIRMSYELEDKGKAILKFLKDLEWGHFGLIYRVDDVYYETLSRIVTKHSRESNMVKTCTEFYRRAKNKTVLTDLHSVMEKMKACSRVIVVLGGEREVRQMLLIAYELNMTHSGEYAFICPELMRSEAYGNASWAGGKEEYSLKLKIKKAYEALMIVTLDQPRSKEYMEFTAKVKERAREKYNFEYKEKEVNYFTASFHDAVWLLCHAINQTGAEEINATVLLSNLKNLKGLAGVSGNITIDENGDRVAEYALLDQTDTENGSFEAVLKYSGSNKLMDNTDAIHWPGGVKPKALPDCGFDGKGCQEEWFPMWQAVLTAVMILLIVIIIIGIFVYRKLKLEAELANMVWKVRWEELTFTKNCRSSWMMSRLSLTSAMSSKMEKGWVCWAPKLRDVCMKT